MSSLLPTPTPSTRKQMECKSTHFEEKLFKEFCAAPQLIISEEPATIPAQFRGIFFAFRVLSRIGRREEEEKKKD